MEKEKDLLFRQLTDRAQALAPELSALRRDLHQHPELGWQELRTSALVAKRLRALGFDQVLVGDQVCDRDSRMGVPAPETLAAHARELLDQGEDPALLAAMEGGMTGVIGILRCGPGPVAALRFDMDALPISEPEDPAHAPAAEGFRSQAPGIMHACGHDGHVAIGLGTAQVLAALRQRLRGTVKLIFQPAEEEVRGAKSIVEKGHLEDVDYLLGAHLRSDAPGPGIGLGPNRTLATAKLDACFLGKAAHAGLAPDRGNNAMLAACTAVLNLHAIPRYGAAPTRVNVGKLKAGSGRNVICDRAELELELRGLTDDANAYMTDYARRILQAAAEMHGCRVEIRLRGEARGDCNSPALVERVGRLCREKLGLPVTELQDGAGGYISEDYSFLSQRVQSHGGQSCYFMNLTGCTAPLHDSRFDFREEALVQGVLAFTGITVELLTPEETE